MALLLAAAVRLGGLGHIPLAESEAQWAWQAHQLAQGDLAAVGPHPLYILVTSFLFRWLGSGDILARLLPALAGCALVLIPYGWRDRLGRVPALVLAFGLAFDPGLVAVSRLAGGPMLALTSLLLAITFWRHGIAAMAGICFGLALLSGPAVWAGLLTFALCGLLVTLVRRQPLRLPGGDFRRAGLFAGATVLLAGTLLLRVPGGLAGLAASFPAYWSGWALPSGVPLGRSLFALVAYQPLGAAFALIALARLFQKPERTGQFWLIALLAALAVALLAPGRQVTDLVWALVPLWALAAGALARLILPGEDENPQVVAGMAFVLLVFLGYIWFSLAGLGTARLEDPATLQLRLALSAIVLGLAAVSTVLVGIGWSYAEAGRGALWAVFFFLFFFTLQSMNRVALARETVAAELWWNGPAPGYTDLLAETLSDLSEFHLGERTSLDITIQLDRAAVAWALRDRPNILFTPQLAPAEDRAALVTSLSAIDPLTSAGYRGQSFAIGWQPDWGGPLPPNLIGWLLFRQAPALPDTAILWGRADLFPGGALPGVQP